MESSDWVKRAGQLPLHALDAMDGHFSHVLQTGNFGSKGFLLSLLEITTGGFSERKLG